MGVAYVEVGMEALVKPHWPPHREVVRVLSASDNGDGTFLAKVESPLLADDCPLMREAILTDTELRFKRWTEA